MVWLVVLVLPFILIVFFGAPYVPTLRKQQREAAKLFNLQKGDLIVDLGAGDGGVVIAMAKQGYKAVGYELNPFVFAVAYVRCLPYSNASIKLGNYWSMPLPEETKGVYVFLATKFMARLDKKIVTDLPGKPVQLVSFGFELPNKKPLKTVDGLHLYQY